LLNKLQIMNNLKKGDIVYFLGNNVNRFSIVTCYEKGDRLKVLDIRESNLNNDLKLNLVKLNSNNEPGDICQIAQADQVRKEEKWNWEQGMNLHEMQGEVFQTLALSAFPEQGWCPDPPKEFNAFLAKRFNMDVIKPHSNGFAWNATSYWPISVESGKPKYFYSEIKDTVNWELKNVKHLEKKVKSNFKNGKVCIGDIVKIKSPDTGDILRVIATDAVFTGLNDIYRVKVESLVDDFKHFWIDLQDLEYLNETLLPGDNVQIINPSGCTFNAYDVVTITSIDFKDTWPLRCTNFAGKKSTVRIEYVKLVSKSKESSKFPLNKLKSRKDDLKKDTIKPFVPKDYIDRIPKIAVYTHLPSNKNNNKDLVVSLLNVKDRKIK